MYELPLWYLKENSLHIHIPWTLWSLDIQYRIPLQSSGNSWVLDNIRTLFLLNLKADTSLAVSFLWSVISEIRSCSIFGIYKENDLQIEHNVYVCTCVVMRVKIQLTPFLLSVFVFLVGGSPMMTTLCKERLTSGMSWSRILTDVSSILVPF